jgi:peptidoglycan/LPS O-acetylase OafA/YrhL
VKGEHLRALTGLRFILALWVILHHLTGPGAELERAAQHLPHPVYAFIRGGYLAVATFFVLSGFVLARSYGSGEWHPERLRRYAMARFARIYPVYALSLALVVPFMIADRTPGKPGLIVDYGLLLQGWTGHLPVGWNTPAWSLSCEVFFYICFPLALVALIRVHPAVLAVAACLLTRALFLLGVRDEWKPLVHFADFLMGMAASSLYDSLKRSRWAGSGDWFYLPGAALGAALIAWPEVLPKALDLNTALRPLNAILLVGFALGTGLAARLLASPLSVYLGKASYAMYILHIPVLWWLKRWAPHISPAAYVAAVILVSAAVYRYYEEPVSRYLRSQWGGAMPGPERFLASPTATP